MLKRLNKIQTIIKSPLAVFLISFLTLSSASISFALDESPEQIYQQNCMVCHGYDGSGNMPGVPDFYDSPTLFTQTNEELLGRIKNGIQNPGNLLMPPKGGNPELNDEQLRQILIYIKQLVKEE
jgi:mono/diheme cytochrome c family protein